MELKDWLEIVVVPVSLGAVTLLWPYVQSLSSKRQFMYLIDRELREVEPHPPAAVPGCKWPEHLKKTFLHQQIFRDPSQNRDFLLSLDADVSYEVSQLWQAFHDVDSNQWLYYLGKLAKRDQTGKLAVNLAKWKKLISDYSSPLAQ